jgi:hypothetical protein
LPTPPAEIANAACGNCQRRTLRLKLPPAAFVEFLRQKVCKNSQKVYVLQGALCKTALWNE